LPAALPEPLRALASDLVIVPMAPVASVSDLQDHLAALNELLDALINKKFNVHFQPIVHFASGKIFGYEALIRVPQDGTIRKPGQFFRAADKARLVSWMDVSCQERCFEEAARAGVRDHLFANMDAEGLSHLQLTGYDLVERARAYKISPSRVVIEITERQAVEDFPRLAPFIEELRDAGFKIAVDDAGAGYSSLHTIAELRPDFVKIDRSLVRTLQDNGPRRALLSTLTRFASQVGASVIAEGCETRDELSAVIECGVTYGQGYVMARPNDGFKGIRKDIKEFITERMSHRMSRVLGSSYSIEKMARKGVALSPDAPGADAAQKFRKFPDMQCIAMVCDNGHVEGLLTRARWESCGGAEQPEAPLRNWMDPRPLIVDAETPLESAAVRTTYRGGAQFQDDIVVVRGGAFVGLVPIRALMEAIITHKVNGPRYEHPVSGLPTMASAEIAVNEMLGAGKPVGLALVEVAYFRAFNQHFGLSAGDGMLQETAAFLRDAVGADGQASHLRGNDFLLTVAPEKLEAVCKRIAESYAQTAHDFYSAEERKQGFFQTVDPAGQARRVPLAVLRIYGLSSKTKPFPTFSQAYRLLAAMRHTARRAGLPQNESTFRIE
jgi:EAL domain-containing protein (putative c-di-GMP-specific phosphodiesterase class I)